ncbi:MAG: TrkA family potassium uptake protein [Desulfitobacteriaceae bacterium]|nr:TrkA family potassium uptake protein [Desulfitobacteriaceae bacterium]MDD4752910.1 TrkA family potassium uptake protein [Desulfitobacteriaceae bacterium]
MKKSVLVIGLGRFGQGVVEGLYELGHDIFAIDKDEEVLEDIREMIVSGAILDVAENDDDLTRIVGEKNFDEAVIAMGQDFEGALLATHVLKEAGIPVTAKAANARRGHILKKMGADRVILPERDTGWRLAQFISNSAAVDILELPQGFVVEQITIGAGINNQTIAELNANNRFGVWILLIYNNDIPITPTASTRLHKGDVMIIFGKKDNMTIFEKENFKGE